MLIGERSELLSDKLGGEFFISSCMLVCLSLVYMGMYDQTTNTMQVSGLFLAVVNVSMSP